MESSHACTGSSTPRGPRTARDSAASGVAFRRFRARRHPGQAQFRGSIAGLRAPLSTLRCALTGRQRMTRGHRDSLDLRCRTLSFPSLMPVVRRFPENGASSGLRVRSDEAARHGDDCDAARREALHERGLSFHAGVPASDHLHGVAGSPGEVDEYLHGVEEPGRSTLQTLRRTILEIVPDAEQVISCRVPAFRVRGETVAGFAAFKNHLSYLPLSGSVLSQLADELDGYTMTKSSLHFPDDRPLPKALVKKLIAVRLAQVGRRSR